MYPSHGAPPTDGGASYYRDPDEEALGGGGARRSAYPPQQLQQQGAPYQPTSYQPQGQDSSHQQFQLALEQKQFEAGSQSATSGGGFFHQPEGDVFSTQPAASQAGRRKWSEKALTPVHVKMLLEATPLSDASSGGGMDDDSSVGRGGRGGDRRSTSSTVFSWRGATFSGTVSLVAAVRIQNTQTTVIEYILEDGTQSSETGEAAIRARYFIDDSPESSELHTHIYRDFSCGVPNGHPQYVRAYGRLHFGPRSTPELNLFRIEPLEDHNVLTMHMADVLLTYMQKTKGRRTWPAPTTTTTPATSQMQAAQIQAYGGPMSQSGAGAPASALLPPSVARPIYAQSFGESLAQTPALVAGARWMQLYNYMHTTPRNLSERGVSLSECAEALGWLSREAEVEMSKLAEQGQAYSTVDGCWKTTD